MSILQIEVFLGWFGSEWIFLHLLQDFAECCNVDPTIKRNYELPVKMRSAA